MLQRPQGIHSQAMKASFGIILAAAAMLPGCRSKHEAVSSLRHDEQELYEGHRQKQIALTDSILRHCVIEIDTPVVTVADSAARCDVTLKAKKIVIRKVDRRHLNAVTRSESDTARSRAASLSSDAMKKSRSGTPFALWLKAAIILTAVTFAAKASQRLLKKTQK